MRRHSITTSFRMLCHEDVLVTEAGAALCCRPAQGAACLYMQDVMKKVDALQGYHRSARDKIPLMISMTCIPPQTLQQYMQVRQLSQCITTPRRSEPGPCPPPVSITLPALVCQGHPELPCEDSKKVLHDCQCIARDVGLRSWLRMLQKLQTCFPEDEVRQAQTIVAKRRRDLAKQPSGPQKVLPPSTP